MFARSWRELGWIAAPFAAYLFVLQRLWFDAPILDDYYIALSGVMVLQDAQWPGEWLRNALSQHSEHRIAVVRVAAWAIASLPGPMDLRVLTLLGNLPVLGLALLAWAEFRDGVAAPFAGAAAILVMQWSFYEASIMATAALPILGVVFFSSACLFFATRAGATAALAALGFGLLAAGSQANGFIALPLAAAASLLMGRRGRAALLAAAAIALWTAHFWSYQRPTGYPSPMLVLSQPVAAVGYFLRVLGSIAPGRLAPVAVGAAAMALLAWLTWRGAWKRFPAAGLCVAFVLASAAAITAGRVVFGAATPSPRYAIYSTWLLAIAFLAACAELRLSGRRTEAFAMVAALAAAVVVSWAAWRAATELSRAGHMLVKAVPADARIVVSDQYPWTLHAGAHESRAILAAADRRGLYSPPLRLVHAPALRPLPAVPAEVPMEGAIDEVAASGNRVIVGGWSPIAASVPNRTLAVHPATPAPALARYELVGRPDVGMLSGDPELVLSGFRLELEYPSAEAARQAAGSLCIVAEAPGARPALLSHRVAPAKAGVQCPRRE